MKGFEAIPSALIDDDRLSLQARAVYGVLRKLLWQQTRSSEDTMTGEIGTVDEIAAAAGCGKTAMKEYLAELRETGWLTLERKRRGHPYTLTVYSDPIASTEPDSGPLMRGRFLFGFKRRDRRRSLRSSGRGLTG